MLARLRGARDRRRGWMGCAAVLRGKLVTTYVLSVRSIFFARMRVRVERESHVFWKSLLLVGTGMASQRCTASGNFVEAK